MDTPHKFKMGVSGCPRSCVESGVKDFGVISVENGYQIYIGQPMRYEIFAISAVAFIVSLFLPSILKIVPSTLGSVNDRLKRFVFK